MRGSPPSSWMCFASIDTFVLMQAQKEVPSVNAICTSGPYAPSSKMVSWRTTLLVSSSHVIIVYPVFIGKHGIVSGSRLSLRLLGFWTLTHRVLEERFWSVLALFGGSRECMR